MVATIDVQLHYNNRLLPATCEKQGRNRGSDKLHRIHRCKWQEIRGLDTRYKIIFLGGEKIVIIPGETPLSLIHQGNMVKVGKAGATLLLASPAFYRGTRA